MRAIGQVEVVGGAHFVERPALVTFLDDMIAAPSVEEALRARMAGAEPPPKPKTLRVSLPADLRRAMLPDLPSNVVLSPGRIEINAATAVAMLESLLALAMVMQNDLGRFQEAIEPPAAPGAEDNELRQFFGRLRESHPGEPASLSTASHPPSSAPPDPG